MLFIQDLKSLDHRYFEEQDLTPSDTHSYLPPRPKRLGMLTGRILTHLPLNLNMQRIRRTQKF